MAMQKYAMNKQKGMTAISWVVVIAFVAFNGLVAINVAPVYFTDSNITSIWQKLETDAEIRGKSVKQMKQIIHKRLKINNVYDINKDDIEISKSKGSYIIYLMYEPRGTIVGSLDYIVTFEHEVKIPAK